MRLLLFAIVAAGNALTLNRIQSVAKLLRCGDFEHLARSFDDDALVMGKVQDERIIIEGPRQMLEVAAAQQLRDGLDAVERQRVAGGDDGEE